MGDHRLAVRLLGLTAVLAAACAAPSAAGRVLDYELTLAIRADGTMAVDERARVQFDAAHAGEFSLPVSGWRVDAIRDHRVTVDGTTAGPSAAAVDAEPGGGLRWRAPTPVAGVREFRQTYEALGVLGFQGARGQLIWPAVPPGVDVSEARVTVTWPAGSLPAAEPAIDPADWRVERTGETATFVRQGIDAREDPWLYLDLVLDDLSAAEPAWQTADRRARQLTPALVSAGFFVIVVGAGVLLMLRVRYRAGAVHVAEGERAGVRQGLRVAGGAVLAVAIGGAAVVPLLAGSLGWAPYAVPAGTAVSALILLVGGVTFPVPAGAGVLHSPRSRQQREP